jgi:hypothetical protein
VFEGMMKLLQLKKSIRIPTIQKVQFWNGQHLSSPTERE